MTLKRPILLPSLEEIVYIELNKCLNLYKMGKISEEETELAQWMCMIADPNDEFVKGMMLKNPELMDIGTELSNMGKDKEELIAMLADKYDEITRNTELHDAERRGLERGREETKLQMVMTMISMNFPIDQIVEITGISKEEVFHMKDS